MRYGGMEVLLGLKARGLQAAPALVIGDGALGFWAALDEVYPTTRAQRCWVHKTMNVESVARATKQLSIKITAAYSPEARERSARANRTHQGRLPDELALASITTLEAANHYLNDRQGA